MFVQTCWHLDKQTKAQQLPFMDPHLESLRTKASIPTHKIQTNEMTSILLKIYPVYGLLIGIERNLPSKGASFGFGSMV